MSDSSLDLSVILINWNSYSVTAAALTSIRARTAGIAYEVFVVDNGTTEDDGPRLIPEQFPWARTIINPENLGFTKANNQGLRLARGRYVLLLNNDTIQTENALGEAVRYMDDHPDVGALGILHRNNDAQHSYQPSSHSFPRPWREVRALLGLTWGRVPPVPAEPPPEQDVDWVCGSFLMIRRACLEEVGGLDERFFSYDEDIDWCLRARQAGWRVRFWPATSMVHLGSAAIPFMKDKTFMMFRSHLSYVRKHHGRAAAAGYYLAMGLRLGLASLKHALLCLARRSTWAELGQRLRRQWLFLTLRTGGAGG